MLLPEDEASVGVLGLPQHLRGYPGGYEDACVRIIGEMRQEFQTAHDHAGQSLNVGNLDGLDNAAKAKREAMSSLVGIAHSFGSMTFGEDVWKRHEEVFGEMLGRG